MRRLVKTAAMTLGLAVSAGWLYIVYLALGHPERTAPAGWAVVAFVALLASFVGLWIVYKVLTSARPLLWQKWTSALLWPVGIGLAQARASTIHVVGITCLLVAVVLTIHLIWLSQEKNSTVVAVKGESDRKAAPPRMMSTEGEPLPIE